MSEKLKQYMKQKKKKKTPVWSVVEKHLKDSNDYKMY